jgi:hypothetical protein
MKTPFSFFELKWILQNERLYKFLEKLFELEAKLMLSSRTLIKIRKKINQMLFQNKFQRNEVVLFKHKIDTIIICRNCKNLFLKGII